MAIKEFTPSRDWVKTIRDNFGDLSKQGKKANVVVGDGWKDAREGASHVESLPLNNGKILKILHLEMSNSSVKAGDSFSHAVTLPDDFGILFAPPVNTSASAIVDGHFQGTLEFYGTDYNHIGFWYLPLVAQGGPFNISLSATLLYM